MYKGAARGIGLALARGAAELGSDVAILDTLQEPSEDLKIWEQMGIRVKYYRYHSWGRTSAGMSSDLVSYRTDVTQLDQLTNVFGDILADFGQIDNWYEADLQATIIFG
jgi:NAD(P)-dependent dehydrogenase (short-subunit alcohol dehydrogenase family)